MRHQRLALVLLSTIAFLVLLATSAAPAYAQYGPQGPPPGPPGPQPGYYPPPQAPPPGIQRGGFTFGGGLGLGSFDISCDTCTVSDRYGGGGGELHIGGMVTPRVGILFEFWAVGSSINDAGDTLFHNIGTVALRWFATNMIWLQGGLGWSNFSLSYANCVGDCTAEGDTGGAIMFGVGVEILQMRYFALDLSLRLGGGSYSDGTTANMSSLQIGVNWY